MARVFFTNGCNGWKPAKQAVGATDSRGLIARWKVKAIRRGGEEGRVGMLGEFLTQVDGTPFSFLLYVVLKTLFTRIAGLRDLRL